MRKISFLSVLVLFTLTAGIVLSRARTATPPSSLLDVLPDGNAAAVIDVQKIAGSSLWTVINAQDKLKGEIDKAQSEMADLGLKLSDVHTVALVFRGAGFNTPAVAVSGGFEQNDLLGRLRSNSKYKLSSEKYKGLEIYTVKSVSTTTVQPSSSAGTRTAPKQSQAQSLDRESSVSRGEETSFVFHDSTTVVIGSLEAVRTSVDVKSGAKPGLSQNNQLSSALAQNPSAPIRFAISLTSSMTSGLKNADLPVDFSSINMVFGTIDVGQGIDLDATLRSDTAENAKSLSEKLSSLLALASGLVGSMSDPKLAAIGDALKTVRIVNTDTDVRITGSVPMDLLNSLISSTAKK